MRNEEIAEGTIAFHFEKPSDFSFIAGQFISLSLIDPPETDAEGDTRAFTIASAPYERDLMIATRMRDTAFKRILRKLKPGELIRVRGPFGSLTLHDDATRAAVFLAGGIGITPFRSIVLQSTQFKSSHRLFLFYSNRHVEDAAFLDELKRCERSNPHFKCIATVTKPSDSERHWDGEMGYVNKTMVLKFIHDLQEPIYYIAGPPGMVVSMQLELKAAGVPSQQIRAEQFAGY
ncbi:MAG TPA: FAD-dependent oxidoreductase [Pyrinomonadaceae bacterium]|nr:FAD-dependent oxidoreductase [Pyrinomonadaceae bacterium]